MKGHNGYALLTPRGQIGSGVEAPHLVIRPTRLLYCIYPSLKDAKAAQRENPTSMIQRVRIEAA